MKPLSPKGLNHIELNTTPSSSSAQLAQLRKDNAELKAKCILYEKAFAKSNQKSSEAVKDHNHLKASYDALTKELSISKLSNEKILADRLIKDTQLEQSKAYIIKLEGKIVEMTKTKSQSLVEQNSDLKKGAKALTQELSALKAQVNDYEHHLKESKREIDVLHKALGVKVEGLKYKNDIKSSLLYDVGVIKQELDEMRIKQDELQKDKERLQKDNEKKMEQLQGLSFDKTNLVEEIAEKKSDEAKKEAEMQMKDKLIKELQNERNGLNRQMEKLKEMMLIKRKKEKCSIVIEESKAIHNQNDKSKKAISTQSTNELITSVKSQFSNEKTTPSELHHIQKTYESTVNELKLANLKLKQMNDTLSKQMNSIEKEKKTLTESSQVLSHFNAQLKEELIKVKEEAESSTFAKADTINQMASELTVLNNELKINQRRINDYETQSQAMTQESNALKEELRNSKLQIEKIRATNYLLHQNLANAVQSSQSLLGSPDDLTPVQLGSVKVSEMNMMSLIKKEREKNKEYNDLIKQYKKQNSD